MPYCPLTRKFTPHSTVERREMRTVEKFGSEQRNGVENTGNASSGVWGSWALSQDCCHGMRCMPWDRGKRMELCRFTSKKTHENGVFWCGQTVVLALLIAGASAFMAPMHTRSTTALAAKSKSIPFLECPEKLDGSLVRVFPCHPVSCVHALAHTTTLVTGR